MFALCSNITIGKFKTVKPHEVKIEKSIFQFTDKAVIKLPTSARLKQTDECSETVETAKQFEQGDKVTIDLGYNGILKNEFVGFINRINFTTPLEVECEGYSYQLRLNSYKKTFVNTQLVTVLKYLVANTDIVLLEKYVPDLKIVKIIFDNNNGTECLEKIKNLFFNTVGFFFDKNELYAGLVALKQEKVITDHPKNFVKYRLGYNVIKDGNLKLHQAKNDSVIVNIIGEKKDGTKVKVTHGKHTSYRDKIIKTKGAAGADGETLVLKSHGINDAKTLQTTAEAKHASMVYDGYEGKITTFGIPYCQHNWTASIEDKKYKERTGNYLVTGVEVNYGMSGYRRIVAIGLKL